MIREKTFIFMIMLVAVPLAGELKFYPFAGDFRVSFGTPVFFFFLLWLRNFYPLLSGLLVGTAIVIFRMFLVGVKGDEISILEAFMMHIPALFYYVAYGLMFAVIKVHRFYDRPFLVGLFGIVLEIGASMAEISLRYTLSGNVMTLSTFILIIEIAFIRSFFVLGFFNILILRQAKLAKEHQQKRIEHMSMLISNLYAETIQLNKSMKHAEEITRTCYELYQKLIMSSEQGLATDALKITGQVHEIKKDNQRIYAGLSNLISNESITDFMRIEELGKIIIKSNEKYARLLGKEIKFFLDVKGDHPPYHTYLLLSLINNLVSNAVEAIKDTGIVTLSASPCGQKVEFRVTDNGPGIPEKKQELIFKHGYTTKYDLSGKPSTGIGLSYVKEVVESFGGTITVKDSTKSETTIFVMKIPIEHLVQKG
ncbi:sensor histidine kinase [Alkalihalobacillus sp. BA299]|uniref:sensor histidine kinase n=1 Tax=Alkalihalobacillus sp. BA299 TaxID=2815938 RepID=UPI001FFE17C5|nr:sensor histidine kinase [Alkalihalobacillus sp. BA299]